MQSSKKAAMLLVRISMWKVVVLILSLEWIFLDQKF